MCSAGYRRSFNCSAPAGQRRSLQVKAGRPQVELRFLHNERDAQFTLRVGDFLVLQCSPFVQHEPEDDDKVWDHVVNMKRLNELSKPEKVVWIMSSAASAGYATYISGAGMMAAVEAAAS
ncbi:hypothetical protein C8J57DRAFT_1228493 [Mycena rebaudengoi]|nr:hypothetical protein C8J57DRAFT_1228493 [Mycena rebaudengoi]